MSFVNPPQKIFRIPKEFDNSKTAAEISSEFVSAKLLFTIVVKVTPGSGFIAKASEWSQIPGIEN